MFSPKTIKGAPLCSANLLILSVQFLDFTVSSILFLVILPILDNSSTRIFSTKRFWYEKIKNVEEVLKWKI